MAAAFCGDIEAAGHKAMIYFNQELGYFHYDLSRLVEYDFWLAEYKEHPSFYYDFDIWQYSSTGRVAGIEGSVDLNLCFGDCFAAG
jgi:GH25 family lysozyme M1 (1,4-beta-N-acetylmuramidase)